MHVLLEVAVDAVHPLLEMDVLQVHGDAGPAVRPVLDRGLECDLRVFGRDRIDDPTDRVEQVSLAVVLEDCPEHPPVAVEVGELREPESGVQLRRPRQEVGARAFADLAHRIRIEVGPESADGGRLGVLAEARELLFGRRTALVPRVHELAVGLVVPPGIAEIAVREAGAGMHVTDDALARRDRPRERVTDRMAPLAVRNGRIDGGARAEVARARVRSGVEPVAVVGVDHVAGAAAAGAIVPGMIVGAEERERRVEQPGALETLEDRVRARERAVAAEAEPVVTPLEDAQHVARLRDLEPRQGHERREHALHARRLESRLRDGLEPLRAAVRRVALAEVRVFQGERTVVVQRCAPEHRAVGHHALTHTSDLGRVAAARAAGLVRHPEVARVHEADEVGAFLQERSVGILGVRRGLPDVRLPRQDVHPLFGLGVLARARRDARGKGDLRPPAVAVGAAELHRAGLVHRRGVRLGVARHTSRARALDVRRAAAGEVVGAGGGDRDEHGEEGRAHGQKVSVAAVNACHSVRAP